jgi:mRNA interferase YafQ
MALALLTTTAFERTCAAAKRQGKDVEKLEVIVNLLQSEEALPMRCRTHRLSGNWSRHWDCHVAPDWVLLYRLTEEELILVRTGSHSEIFGR